MQLLMDDTTFPFRLQCAQWKLTQRIKAQLDRLPHVQIIFSSRVASVDQTADGVQVQTDGQQHCIGAGYLIGADGCRVAVVVPEAGDLAAVRELGCHGSLGSRGGAGWRSRIGYRAHNRYQAHGARWHDPSRTKHKMDFTKELDAAGLACPLPIVKTKKALADMASGQVLRVIATDPGSVSDMAAFAEQTGHALLQQGRETGRFIFYLKKS